MYATSNLHHEIIKVGFGIAQDIVHNTASFDTGNDMFNEDTDTGNHRILGSFFRTEFLLSGLFLRLICTDLRRFKPLEACIFKEDTARRKRVVFFITNAFVMDASSKCLTEIANQTLFNIDDQVVFHRMVFFLPLYFSCCSVASCGRWTRRSVPSMIKSTDTQSARVCSRFFGSLSGNAWAFPNAIFKMILSR